MPALGFGLTARRRKRAGGGAVGAPPGISAALPDQIFVAGTGVQTFATAHTFTGTGLSYALARQVETGGSSINPVNGIAAIDTGAVPIGNHRLYVEGYSAYGFPVQQRVNAIILAAPLTIAAQAARFNDSALLGSAGEAFKPYDTAGRAHSIASFTLISGSLGGLVPTIDGTGGLVMNGSASLAASAVLRLTLVTPVAGVATVDVTITPSATRVHPATAAEMITAVGLSTGFKSGGTIAGRNVDISGGAQPAWTNKFINLTARLTITADSPAAPEGHRFTIRNIIVGTSTSSAAEGDLNILDLDIYYPGTNGDMMTVDPSPTGRLACVHMDQATSRNLTVARNRLRSNAPNNRLTRQRPVTQISGFYIHASSGGNVLIEDNDISDVYNGFFLTTPCVGFTIRSNHTHHFYNDGFGIVTDANSLTIDNIQCDGNWTSNPMGDGGLHQDRFHIYNSGGASCTVSNFNDRAYVHWQGYEGMRCGSYPKNAVAADYLRVPALVDSAAPVRVINASADNGFFMMDSRLAAVEVQLADLTAGGVSSTAGTLVASYTAGPFTKRINANGTTLLDLRTNTTVSEIVLTSPNESYALFWNQGQTRWEATMTGWANQINFGNPVGGTINGLNFDFGIGWANDAAVRQDGPFGVNGVKARYNLFIPVWPGDLWGDGKVNTMRDGFYTSARGGRYGQLGTVGTNGEFTGNVIDNTDLGAGGALTTGRLNYLSGRAALQTSWAAMTTHFSVANPAVQQHYPLTFIEAVNKARPLDGGPLDQSSFSAGLQPLAEAANDYVNFGQFPGEARGFRNNRPWIPLDNTFIAIPGGVHLTWFGAFSQHASGITGYTVIIKKNGVDETPVVLSSATLQYTYSTGVAGDVIEARMFASDANGDGMVRNFNSVTLAAGVAPTIPSLTLLGSPSYGGATILAGTTTSGGNLTPTQTKPLFITLAIRKASASAGDVNLSSVTFGGVPLLAGPFRKGGLNNSIEIYTFYLPTASVPAGPGGISFVPSQNVTGWSTRIEEVTDTRVAGTIFGNSIGSSQTSGTSGGAALTNSAINSLMACTMVKNGTSAITLGLGAARTTNPAGTIAAHYFSHAQENMAAIAQQSINGTWTSDQSAVLAVEILGATS